MSVPTQKILVVFGATGNQGGSVINSILGDPRTAKEFRIKGITRDPSKPNAKALINRGVECVEGDMNSKESLEKALKGAYAVFAVTNYWEKMDEELELKQGKLIADVALASGVQHLIWSSLYNVKELTKGAFPNVHHFDSKAKVEAYIRTLSGLPATFFMPGFYMSNLASGMLHPSSPTTPNEYILALPIPPHTQIPLFDAGADTGNFIKGILLHREELLGKRVLAATEYYTLDEIVREFNDVTKEGVTAKVVTVSEAEFKEALGQMPEKGKVEMYENMAFMTNYGYYGKHPLEESHKILDEKPTTWKAFVATARQWADLH